MNNVILIGRLTKDPEIRAAGETNVCNFTLAVQRKKEEVDFISCVAFGKAAENMVKYTAKGLRVAISGSIRTDKYDHNGETRYSTRVVAQSVNFLDWKPKDETVPDGFIGIKDEDMPF